MTKRFIPRKDLTILLRDEKLKGMLTIVEVRDSEIALRFENSIFAEVLTPGRYAYWNGVVEHGFKMVDLSVIEIDESLDKTLLNRREVLAYQRVFEVESYEKGLLYVDGKFVSILDRGTYRYWRNATNVKIDKVDVRQKQLEIPGQEMLTRDKAALRINFMAKYQVTDVVKAIVDNKDYEKQLYVLVQLALRSFVGTYSLDELLDQKDKVSDYVLKVVRAKSKDLGVDVLDAGVRDIILPGDVKDIMNQVLIAEKRAQANVIMRREETASTRSLLNTAKLMEDNEMLFKLKEMEYVEKIAEKIGEITVSGNGQVLDQLKGIFSTK
jgi:regulator of protease activity HflC (stomatin/prohibitin superfamily)